MIFDTISVKVRWEQSCRWNWSEGYKCTKTGIFCRTENVAMTLKIICTYAHYVILGSHCKPQGNWLGKKSSSNLQGWSSDTIVSSWAFVYFILVISSFSSLVRRMAFQSFSFCLAFSTGWTSSGSLPFIVCFILFSQFILVCFIVCKNEKVLFVLV